MRDPWPPTAMGGVLKTLKTFVAWMPTRSARHLKCQMFVLGLVLPFEVFGFPSMTDVGSSCRCLPLGVGPQVVPAEKAVLALASQE